MMVIVDSYYSNKIAMQEWNGMERRVPIGHAVIQWRVAQMQTTYIISLYQKIVVVTHMHTHTHTHTHT